MTTEDRETDFEGRDMITLIWHIYSNEFKGLQRLQDKSILLAPESSTWGFETTIDGLLVFKEIEDNKTCEMKPIRDNLGEGRAPGSGPLLASIPGLCPSPSPPSLVNAAWPTSHLTRLVPSGLRKSPDRGTCFVTLPD